MSDQPDIKYRIVTEADMAGVEKFKEGTRGAAGLTSGSTSDTSKNNT